MFCGILPLNPCHSWPETQDSSISHFSATKIQRYSVCPETRRSWQLCHPADVCGKVATFPIVGKALLKHGDSRRCVAAIQLFETLQVLFCHLRAVPFHIEIDTRSQYPQASSPTRCYSNLLLFKPASTMLTLSCATLLSSHSAASCH